MLFLKLFKISKSLNLLCIKHCSLKSKDYRLHKEQEGYHQAYNRNKRIKIRLHQLKRGNLLLEIHMEVLCKTMVISLQTITWLDLKWRKLLCKYRSTLQLHWQNNNNVQDLFRRDRRLQLNNYRLVVQLLNKVLTQIVSS